MTTEPRPIQIWRPHGDDWVRPLPGPFGDHYCADHVLHRRSRAVEKRVVLVGESVAAGYLYAPHYTPAKALGALLPQCDVIDLARTNESLASLRETVAAAIQLEPDVVVMWAGNNWMLRDLGDLSPYHPESTSRRDLGRVLSESGLEGVPAFTRQRVRAHVLPGLDEIRRTLVQAGCKLVVVVPEVNLVDWEQSQPVTVLPDGNESAWHRRFSTRDHQTMTRPDGGSGTSGHRLASASQRPDSDLAQLRQQVDAACGPLRGTTSTPMATGHIQDLLREWATDHELATVDVPAEIERAGDRPDRSWFLDYCHHTGFGIAAVTRSIAHALDTGPVGPNLEVPGELQAVAALGALMHTDHRLVAAGSRRPLLRHWRDQAELAWPGASDLMRDLIESRLGGAPVPLTAAQRRNRRRPFPFGFAHGWRPHTTEADALWALGMTEADSQLLQLQAERAWPAARMWKPGQLRWPDEQPFSRNIGFMRSIAHRSVFGVLNRGRSLRIEITARAHGGGEAVAAIGAWSRTMTLGAEWTTHRLTIGPDEIEPGLQPLTITWPELTEGPERWNAALAALATNRLPDLHPVFGEVFSLRA